TSLSSLRKEPPCPHFDDCSACHYQHVDYETELKFKTEALEHIFRAIPHPEPIVLGAQERLGYRNRIQLHYDLHRSQLGMLDSQTQSITPIPQCLIAVAPIKEKLQQLYQDDSWKTLAPSHPTRGHV